MDDELLPIGRFSRLTGLSVGALRHYDELDLLRPADVDPFTGYRRYRRSQVEIGRIVARLRDLEVPLDEIREVLAVDDPDKRRHHLAIHHSRLEARTFRLQRVLHQLDRITKGREPIVSDAATTALTTELDGAGHRRLGAELFNRTWALLETPDRSPAQTDELIHTAHASRHHWAFAEGSDPRNLARGEWLCSRVYSVLGRPESAVWHAERCVAICEEHGIGDWDIAAAYEAMARARLVAGDEATARDWAARGRAACARIAEDDDRELIAQDLDSLGLS